MNRMRVDVVTAPVRYRRSPLVALVALSLVPVVGLLALASWSDARADEHEAQRARTETPADSAPAEPDDSDVGGATPDTPALLTPVFSYRRAPEEVASAGDDRRLSESMDQLAAFIDDRSCLSVSVDGRPVTAYNAQVPVIPASTQKLLVAAVALEVLGDDHRFTTTVLGPQPVEGVIDGDIALVGGGDPLLTSDGFPTAEDPQPAFNTTSLDELADAVAATGVTSITGSVIGDGSRYDDEFIVPSWGPGVAFVEAGPYDALVVNDARVTGRSGRERDPNVAAAREFTGLLEDRGIRVEGGWESGVADASLPALASIQSQPLDAVVAEMLTTSDDDTAEMLVKELGVADVGEGTLAAGLGAMDRTLREQAVPMDGVRMVDGSGLSSENRVTCAALLSVLQGGQGTALAAGLPVAGRTGTLADQFVGTPVEGRLAAKTGTLGNPPADADPPAVKALAGYVDTDDGDTVEFVLILNGSDIAAPAKYGPYWLALAERLAAYPSGPDRESVGPR